MKRSKGRIPPFGTELRRHPRKNAGTALLLLLLAACGSPVQQASSKLAQVALSAVGLKWVDDKGGSVEPTMRLHLEAANDANAAPGGQGLATVVRLYELRDRNGFLAASYNSFSSPSHESAALGADLLRVHEVMLAPGKAVDLKEKLSVSAAYVGVVGLFRSPDPHRWRFLFPVEGLGDKTVVLGIHACAMTASGVVPIGVSAEDSTRLSSTRCQ